MNMKERMMAEAKMTLIKGQVGPPLPPDDDLWDVKRTAQFLGLSIDGVYRAAERGDIPSVRVLNRRKFVPAELRSWALTRRDGPAL
jgi:hypothetical protein